MLYRNKKENDMNEGKWIGLGGKLEPGESPDECVVREIQEEAGIVLTSYEIRGLVHFIDDSGYSEDMYLYTADKFNGEIGDCNEGELRWVDKDKLFDLNLWEGDQFFLRKLIDDERNFEMTLEYIDNKCAKVNCNNWIR